MGAERVRGSWPAWVWAAWMIGAATLAACTDDPAPKDDGPDAALDGGEDPDLLPRLDSGNVVEGDPIPDCDDRFSPTACPAGMECDVVIRRAPTAEQFTIYTGCVDTGDERVAGEPCVPWGGLTTPIEAEGLTDEAYHDPCAPGLFCAPDPKVRGLNSCQPACDSGISGQAPRGCSSDGDYCTGPGPFEEVCVPGDDCDPRDPSACGAGQGCYLRFNHSGAAAISVCLPVAPEPLADGVPCTYINECMPGASCWGPARVPPSRWVNEDYICRRSCELVEGEDGGVADDDAGTGDSAEDTCDGPLVCTDMGDSVSYDPISAPFGQCE